MNYELCSTQEMIDIIMNDKGVDAKEAIKYTSFSYIRENFGFADQKNLIKMYHFPNLSNEELLSFEVNFLEDAKYIVVYLVLPKENHPSTYLIDSLLSRIQGSRDTITFGIDESYILDTTEVYLFCV